MTMWAHFSFSQRVTWPPRAAVRQFSIADMTLSWPRLTWPALAARHAAPWPRKISATSSAGRGIAAGGYAGGWSSRWLFWTFFDVLRFGRDRRSSGLSTLAIMPVATWAWRAVVSNLAWPNNA